MIYKIILIINVLFSVSANYLLKYAMNKVGIVSINKEVIFKLKTMVASPYLWISVIIYGLSFFTYAIVLSKMELSRSYPVMIMMSTILIFIISIIFFSETINIVKIFGIIFFILGIFLFFR